MARHLSRWHLLSFLKSPQTIAQLKSIKTAHDREAIERLRLVIEEDLGYPLHRAVEGGKVALTSQDETALVFEPADIGYPLTKESFDGWIEPDIAAMEAALERVLDAVGARAPDVQRVFLTGGTSLVPRVRDVFARRFGADRLVGGEELTSVAAGLALAAREQFAT